MGLGALARVVQPPRAGSQTSPTCIAEWARPTLKGSPGPTASPDWEPLKEHLEPGEGQTSVWIQKTQKLILTLPLCVPTPAHMRLSQPQPHPCPFPSCQQATARRGGAVGALALLGGCSPPLPCPGVLSGAPAAPPRCPPPTGHRPGPQRRTSGGKEEGRPAQAPGDAAPLFTEPDVSAGAGQARGPAGQARGPPARSEAREEAPAPGPEGGAGLARRLAPALSLGVGSPCLQVREEAACSSCG